MANGKTVFLKELAFLSLVESLGEVLILSSYDTVLQIRDFDKMIAEKKNFILFIDNYSLYLELIEYYIHTNPSNIKLILTERFTSHRRLQIETDIFFDTKEIVIDKLDDTEAEHFARILQTSALDIKKAGKSINEKIRYIQYELSSEISSVLIDIVKAPQSIDRTKELVKGILTDENLKKVLFALSLIEVMNIPASHALVSELTGTTNLLSNISSDKHLEEVFIYDYRDNVFKSKSSIYSRFLIIYIFGEEPNYIVDNCINFLKFLDNIGQGSIDRFQNEIRISLLKFNFIESILPKQGNRNMLLKYYEDIKRELPRHEYNPHYWLQFAMAHIALKELDKAEQYLNYAYAQAIKRDNYSTNYMDTQKARLLIKKASQGHINQNESIKFFEEADRLLSAVPNNMYKYKIVSEYLTFFEIKSKLLSNKNKDIVKRAAYNRFQEIEKIDQYISIENMKQDRVLEKAKRNLSEIMK